MNPPAPVIQLTPDAIVLTAAGGQGGGSFYVVIFSVLLGFSTNQASVLSAAVVFLG